MWCRGVPCPRGIGPNLIAPQLGWSNRAKSTVCGYSVQSIVRLMHVEGGSPKSHGGGRGTFCDGTPSRQPLAEGFLCWGSLAQLGIAFQCCCLERALDSAQSYQRRRGSGPRQDWSPPQGRQAAPAPQRGSSVGHGAESPPSSSAHSPSGWLESQSEPLRRR